MKNLTRVAAVALTLAVVSAACSADDDADDAAIAGEAGTESTSEPAAADDGCGDEIVFGAHNSVTGRSAPFGQSAERAFELWLDETNSSGGILGHDVRVVALDDASDAGQAQRTATDLVERQGAQFVVGPAGPGPAAVAAPVYAEANVPAVSPGSSGPAFETGGNTENAYSFTLGSDRAVMAGVVANHLMDRELTQVGVIYSTDEYGELWNSEAAPVFEEAGLDIVGTESFAGTDSDLVAPVRALRDAGAQVVVLLSAGSGTIANVVRAMETIQWEPELTGPYGVGGAGWSEMPAAAERTTYAQYGLATQVDGEPASDLSAEIGQQVKDVPVYEYALQVYAAAELIKAAIEDAGTCEGDAVREAIESFDGELLGMPVQFSADSHYGSVAESLVMIQAGAKDPETGLYLAYES